MPLSTSLNCVKVIVMTVKLVNQLKSSEWENMDDFGYPFLSHKFFQALERSGSVGEGTGWNPLYLGQDDKSLMFTYIKEHSYGEYIFDWDWANFYHQYNIAYYPKLTSMIPFTSATTHHFLGESSQTLMKAYEDYYLQSDVSSSHFLFLHEEELSFFKSFDYILRDSFQYHFSNNSYTSFDDFLSHLKSRKAKQIRKERVFTKEITFKKHTGESLSQELAREMYFFYRQTINNKNAIAYLTESFFIDIFENLKDNIYYVQALKNELPIAGSLFLYSDKRLYGRYWGAKEDIPNLHFELCLYQGIEICIKKELDVFEAGAQGEHKISRGFKPVKTYSAHKFKRPEFHNAIKKYIESERDQIEVLMDSLSERLPFKLLNSSN